MKTLNVFFDANHVYPEESGLNDYLKIIENVGLKGILYEFRIYQGVVDDLINLTKDKLNAEELLLKLKNKLPGTICSPCINSVLKFSSNNKVPILPFGINGSDEGNESEYLINLQGLIEQELEEGNYSLILGALHEEFFNQEVKPLLEKYFDKVVQSVSGSQAVVKN